MYVIGDFNTTTPNCRYPELNRIPYRARDQGGTHRNVRELDWIFTNREIQVKTLPQSLNTSDHILAYFDMPEAHTPIKKPRYQFREKLVEDVNEILVNKRPYPDVTNIDKAIKFAYENRNNLYRLA